jgi:acyl dehydratase
MSLEDVAGAKYGPYQMRISPEKVAEYVAATGDEPDRWTRFAPPGFAGALLFVVAPHFLADPRVKPFTGVLVHVDQTFTWHGPLLIGAPIIVTGRVDKVRERGGRFFVSFSAAVDTPEGERLLDAVATFLMGQAESAVSVDDRSEPVVERRQLNETPSVRPRPDVGRPFQSMDKSASRLDLVKYAAASGDYNPIHFDHDAARGAGLDGIVVHGLLMAAWALQTASGVSARPDPIAFVKLRFRNPLQPGAQAAVTGTLRDMSEDAADARVGLVVTSNDQQLVTAQCVVRLEA